MSFNRLTKTNMTITPYRGTAPALTDVAGGHIQMLIDAMVVLLPMAKSGGVKALAVTTTKRSAAAPDIPTAAESGVPGLNVVSWYGMWGPKGMPADVVKALNAATAEAMRELETVGPPRGPRRRADLQHARGFRATSRPTKSSAMASF